MAAERSDAIVFIHGFASTFKTALQRAAQLRDVYTFTTGPARGARQITPQVFVFSWPSDGAMIPFRSYASDRQDAGHSGTAMARALARLLEFLREQAPRDEATGVIHCNQRIHLVAHSMGNWALRRAVLGLAELMGAERLPRLFDNVFLMAADEDSDALGDMHKLGYLPQLGRNVHVYHSQDDKALRLSRDLKMNGDRLGSTGPKTFDGLPLNVHAIDCVSVDYTDDLDPGLLPEHVRHQYYRLRAEVIKDVRAVLGGLRPEAMPWRAVIRPGQSCRISQESRLSPAGALRRGRSRGSKAGRGR
jgi:esterase/lipase superfamily enzyme